MLSMTEADKYKQLDYLLVCKQLAQHSVNAHALPLLIRGGQPKRATRVTQEHFAGVGWNRPKASDHCPLAIDLVVPADTTPIDKELLRRP